ncbi:MAG TPA: hypothetical protein VNQ76_17540 [Planctomicrobium sp.]|nr:hypothetical protein [Planctomicrobium sp.]
MLKVNVGLSKKLSRDFNSTGFSLNLEGELSVPLDDPEGMIERIKEFYDLAEEALNQQIERATNSNMPSVSVEESRRSSAMNSPSTRTESSPQKTNGQESPRFSRTNGNLNGNHNETIPATNKQIQFLLTIGKREGMSKLQLEERMTSLIGRQTDLYSLTKQEAGLVLDHLTEGTKSQSRRH